jgi:hypothetical protein
LSLVLAIVNAWRPSLSRLQEVEDFGTNPGALRMLTYLPDDLPTRPALVVALHGSTQSAAKYDLGTGWSTLADRHGFALLMPEQSRQNNLSGSFNWFQRNDTYGHFCNLPADFNLTYFDRRRNVPISADVRMRADEPALLDLVDRPIGSAFPKSLDY